MSFSNLNVEYQQAQLDSILSLIIESSLKTLYLFFLFHQSKLVHGIEHMHLYF